MTWRLRAVREWAAGPGQAPAAARGRGTARRDGHGARHDHHRGLRAGRACGHALRPGLADRDRRRTRSLLLRLHRRLPRDDAPARRARSSRSVSRSALVAAGFGVFVVGGGFAVDRRALRGLGASREQARIRVLGLGALEYAVLAPVAWICALLLLDSETSTTGCYHVGDRGARWRADRALARVLAAPHARRQLASQDRLARRRRDASRAARSRAHREHNPAWMGIGVYWIGELLSTWAGLRLFGIHLPRRPPRARLRDGVRDDPARSAARGRWHDGGADAARVHVGGRPARRRRARGLRLPHRDAPDRARAGADRDTEDRAHDRRARGNRDSSEARCGSRGPRRTEPFVRFGVPVQSAYPVAPVGPVAPVSPAGPDGP